MSEIIVEEKSSFRSFLPAICVIVGSVLMALLRIQVGGDKFISDGALMMLALACYLIAAIFYLTNLYAPSEMAEKVGYWTAIFGVFFNFSSWCVRWVAAYDRELAILLKEGKSAEQMEWVFRFIPFANLYDLSLAFAFGAGITTLLIAQRKSFRFVGAISLPIASLILILARFIGDEFTNLQPVLDSYWRPIHVGVASLSYGIGLVCFAIAVLYLLKDGVKTEAMAIWSSIFGFAVIATIGRWGVLTTFTYSMSTVRRLDDGRIVSLPLRADIPYAGPVLFVTALLLFAVIIAFAVYLSKKNEQARTWGHHLLKLSFVVQLCGIVLIASQASSIKNVMPNIDKGQYYEFGKWLAEQSILAEEQRTQITPEDIERIAQIPRETLVKASSDWVEQVGPTLFMSLKGNPVEFSALITAMVGTFFVILFSFRTERLRESLPPLKKLDSLMYLTASATFAGLAMLLITGAVWANESWGRYWGWDPKETGAFVAWVTYGVFLHTRITHGWIGRRSAYFALLGFMFIIFTYLGVSYLLKGLHSYA